MKLRKIRIHNYRSIRDVRINVSDILVLVGPNNHGKSNILRALDFGLSTSIKPAPQDFFSFRPKEDPDLWVEMTFCNLTEQEQTTFQRYLLHDGTIRIRKTARLTETGSTEVSYNGYIEEPEQWWLKAEAVERLRSRDDVARAAADVPALNELLADGGRINAQRIRDFQDQYIRSHRSELTFHEVLESGPLLGRTNVAGGTLPAFLVVPAVRDLTDEIKTKTTSLFGRLLQSALKAMEERDPRFSRLQDELKNLIGELNARPDEMSEEASDLAQLEKTLALALADWDVSISIEVTPPSLETVFEIGTRVHVDDGVKTPAEEKGHGLQRAVIFALMRAWAGTLRSRNDSEGTRPRQASTSAYFAIEEPELFLHPHAQRQLFESLREIASNPQHQVFICTHSTHFIDLEYYGEIAIVTKTSPREGTLVRQCARDLFADERKRRFHMASWINPDRGEIFFAHKVILVEGETEKVVWPFLAKKLNCFNPNVTVIDCGGKNNLSLYIDILNAFRIPYCVVHDEDPIPDPVPENWSEDRRKTAVNMFSMNSAIRDAVDSELGAVEMLSPDFEGISGVSRSQGEKKGKALAALEHFAMLEPDKLPGRLVEAIRNAYQVGIGR